MFRPLGFFKQIQCPKRHDCDLQNCIFSHDTVAQQEGIVTETYDPLSAGESQPPPSKRRRIDSADFIPIKEHDGSQIDDMQAGPAVPSRRLPQIANGSQKGSETVSRPKAPAKQSRSLSIVQQPESIKRKISPPPTRQSKSSTEEPATSEKAEKLIPRPVARAPAVLKVRLSFIEILYKLMNALNSQIIKSSESSDASLKLTDQRIIKWVLDEEEQTATKLGNDIYRNAMSQRVLQLKRMSIEDWRKLVQERTILSSSKTESNGIISTGMLAEEECQVLKYLRTNLTGLDAHGYVTKPPSAVEIQKAKETIKATGGYELCDRCGVRFQVFPGRDEQGRLATKGKCHYHWAKLNRGAWQKIDHITGQAQSSYPCCGQQAGSEGCTTAATHVFKVTDPKRLAVLLQFEQTTSKNDSKDRGPVAFDCEMAYTTYGLEVVRVTAVSWPHNKELLDILVRPYGEILDLNTRFSGVTQQQYTEALPYDAVVIKDDSVSEDGEVTQKPLRKVDSPAVARQLMFDLLTPDTPLIGHAIDNDLNVCRIIHPFVVDTVLLYPHPRGLPIRYGLKVLSSKFLNRGIQMGGDAGHDSKEDSIATGDLVRLKVMEKWQMMRLQGWKFQDGTLLPPSRQ